MENITVQENMNKILVEWAKNKYLPSNFGKVTIQKLNIRETYSQIPNPIRLPKLEIPSFFYQAIGVL